MAQSPFRPAAGIDQSSLGANRKLVASVERRGFLRGAVSLGALTILTGCDVTNERAVQSVLTAMSTWNDRVQAWLFDSNRLAPTFSLADVVDPPRFNAFYDVEDIKPVDVATWKLEFAGLVSDKRPWTAPLLAACQSRSSSSGMSASKAGTMSATGPART